MTIPMFICAIGGGLTGASYAANSDTGVICGTIYICTGLIITAIQHYGVKS